MFTGLPTETPLRLAERRFDDEPTPLTAIELVFHQLRAFNAREIDAAEFDRINQKLAAWLEIWNAS